MKSPFPGMDPYIEARGLWGDFHGDLITGIKHALALILPERYLARGQERNYVTLAEENGKVAHPFLPDIDVTTQRESGLHGGDTGASALQEPATDTGEVTLRAFIAEEYRERFIEIYEAEEERRLVTCIEVLSPSNKRKDTPGWELYHRKRQALMLGEAHFVEIDLLRGGKKMPMLDPWPKCPYTLLVCRRERAPSCRVLKAHYQHRLPILPLPLLRPDPDVLLDLQPLIDMIYTSSRYHQSINYTKPLRPALSNEENAWLEEQLKARQAQT